MSIISKLLIEEIEQEVALTEKMLNSLPKDKWDYKPHEKSMTIGQLVNHLSEIPTWITSTMNSDGMDMANYVPPSSSTISEAIEAMKQNAKTAIECVGKCSDVDYDNTWAMRRDGETMFEMPKSKVLRAMVLNQMPHHRAQLGVYLRLLDGSVPSTYGPSADNQS